MPKGKPNILVIWEFLATFEDFPPRQKAASFTIDQAMEKMSDAVSGAQPHRRAPA